MPESSPNGETGFLAERLAEQARTDNLTPTPPFPRALMLELSNACNHTCSFCYNPSMARQRRTMDPAFVTRILADAFALGAREVGFATTGEPLANRRLLDYVGMAKSLGYSYTYFSTNGALLDADKVGRIFEVGLDSIKFSINAGTARTYAKVHGEDCFDHVIGMVHLLARRRRELGSELKILVTSILTPDNTQDRSVEQDALREALGGVVDDIAFFDETKAVGPTNGTLAPLPCAMVFDRVHVTCEGYLTACCVDYENNLITADLGAMPLAEAWHSAAFQELRRRHLDKKLKGTLCQVCVSRRMSDYKPLTDIGREGEDVILPTVKSAAPGGDVLVHFTSSLGEIDWLLPVLHRLREQAPDTRIWALVEDRQLQDKLAAAEFLTSELAAVATVLHHGTDRVQDRVAPGSVGLYLKADDPDNDLDRELRAWLPNAKVVVFPSGTALLTRADDPESLVDDYYRAVAPQVGADPRTGYGTCDLVLAGSPHMAPFYRATLPTGCAVHTGGVPRYDGWWVARQKDDPALPASAERRFIAAHDRAVLFVIRGAHWLYQAEHDYVALIEGFLAEARLRPGTAFIIKPHPRQDPAEVTARVDARGCPNVMISPRPLQQLAGMVDLVVSMFSSGVLDALSVGTPVVEHYRYHDRRPVLEFRTASDGRRISIYEDLGLVANLADTAALAGCLDDLERNWLPAVDAGRQAAFRDACALHEDASGAAARALVELLATAGTKELIHA